MDGGAYCLGLGPVCGGCGGAARFWEALDAGSPFFLGGGRCGELSGTVYFCCPPADGFLGLLLRAGEPRDRGELT